LNEYYLVRTLIGAVAMGAAVLTGLVFLMLSGFSKKWRSIMLLQLSGVVLIALGFSDVNFGIIRGETLPSFIVLIGAVLISTPVLRNRAVIFSKSLCIKCALMLMSPAILYLVGGVTVKEILRLFTLISLLFLVNTLTSVRLRSRYITRVLETATWLLVLYSWIGYIGSTLPQCYRYVLLLVYYTSLLLWLFGAGIILINLRGWLGWNA